MAASKMEPFEGVSLGPLLGKGSFGRVYRALWNGTPVAVKVCQAPAQGLGSGFGIFPLTALLYFLWSAAEAEADHTLSQQMCCTRGLVNMHSPLVSCGATQQC